MKAPKFDESPGFKPEENGLWEVKLILTREGLIFVNFDASTMDLPFNNVKSHVDMGACSWVDGMDVTCATNWKDLGKSSICTSAWWPLTCLANEFSSQSQWSQNPFGWFSGSRRQKKAQLLGPLSMIKELNENLWCTMTLLPRSLSEVVVRCDIYAKEGRGPPAPTVGRWKWMLEKELNSLSKPDEVKSGRSYFAYQCGGENATSEVIVQEETDLVDLGRTIDLFAILAQHQRNEKMAMKKLQPAIRVTGTADIDEEAAALCDVLDGKGESPPLENCSRKSSFPQTLEW